MPVPNSDIAQTEIYRSLRGEVAKLDAATGQVDWRHVATLSQQVLLTLGQDLLAAVYWAHAQHKLEGLSGLAAGLELIEGLLQHGWAQMMPPGTRLKARAGAMQWLVQRTLATLDGPHAAPEPELAARIAEAVQRLETLVQQRLADRAPATGALRRAVAAWSTQRGTAEQHPGAPTLAPPTQVAAAAAPPAAPAAIEGDRSARPAASLPIEEVIGMGRQLCALAAARRSADPTDPSAYYLLRLGLWLHMEQIPPHVDGVTRIAPLPQAARAQLIQLQQSQAWAQLLQLTETLVLDHRLCLDLQRLAAQALAGLGSTYAPGLQAMRAAISNLLHRLPQIVTLRAKDGSPLGDLITQQWLAGLSQAPPAAQQVSDESAPKLAAADAPTGGRGEFIKRLGQAEDAHAQGHRVIAQAIYGGLYAQLRQQRLDAWDPPLGERLLRGYLVCLRAGAGGESMAARVYRRLAQLNPELAIALA